MGRYIVDFYCPALQLAIEIDGGHHFRPEVRAYDAVRTAYLNGLGVQVVRITNSEVLTNLAGAIAFLQIVVRRRAVELASSPPRPRGGTPP